MRRRRAPGLRCRCVVHRRRRLGHRQVPGLRQLRLHLGHLEDRLRHHRHPRLAPSRLQDLGLLRLLRRHGDRRRPDLPQDPWYVTLAAQVHIDTPWFLPDVSFQISKTCGQSQPFDSPLATTRRSAAETRPARWRPACRVPMHVPPLSDGNTDPTTLYSFNQLTPVTGAAVTGIVLPRRPDAGRGRRRHRASRSPTRSPTTPRSRPSPTPSPDDPGTQQVQDLTVRYALKSVQIQRSPRFGPQAGTWTDLVAADDTVLDHGGGTVHAAPAVSFAWDADNRADGVVRPTRLLINCRTPYSRHRRVVPERRGGARQRRRTSRAAGSTGQGLPDPLARPELDHRASRACGCPGQPALQRWRRPVVVDGAARDDATASVPTLDGIVALVLPWMREHLSVRSTSATRLSRSTPS